MKITKQIRDGKRIYKRYFVVPDVNIKKIDKYGKNICPNCGATKEFIIKRGTRKIQRDKNKQRYHCYWCSKRFSKGGLFRMKNNFETITKALKLLGEGYSSRDVQKQLDNIVSHVTILRWRKKWTKIKKQRKNMK